MAMTAFSMPGPERRGEGERQHQPRERQEDVGDAHQHGIDDAAEIAGQQSDREPDRHHDERLPATTMVSVMRDPETSA